MCAEFMIKAKVKELARQLGALIPEIFANFDWPERIRPTVPTAVVVERDGARIMQPMRFGLIPSWSKESRVKFATHNARLDTIMEKATWKRPFLSQRCLAPLTHFIEPIYTGEHANHMVRFFAKDLHVLTAAALYDRWIDKETGEEIESFALITDDPSDFVMKIGHDRQPVFLDSNVHAAWLKGEKKDSSELIQILKEGRAQLELGVEDDRAIKGKKAKVS